MKNFIQKFKYVILGVLLASGLSVYAVNVTVPSGNGPGFLLQSLSSGNYGTASLNAGTNVTISSTTNSITISASSATPAGTAGQLQYNGSGSLAAVSTTTATCAGGTTCSAFTIVGSTPVTITGTAGTVTAVSIASANGFTGSSSGGATPAVTLTTSVTGILKGNGTAISAASNGTDYTLITANTCGAGNHVSAITAAGVISCTADTGSGGLSTYDAWTHPVQGQSATTSLMLFNGQASSTQESTNILYTNFFNATSTTATSTITNALRLGSTVASRDNMLQLDCSGRSFPGSISVGGCVNIDGGTTNLGPQLEVIGNAGAGALGRSIVFMQNNTANPQDMILASSSCANCTAMNFKGAPTGKGIIKIEHTGQGANYANASGLSIDLGNATDAQGIFVKGAISGTGKLLNLVDSGSGSLASIDSTGLLTSIYSTSTRYSSFLNASTTNLIINGQSFNNLLGTGLSNSSDTLTVAAVPNSALSNSTISTIALGGTLGSLTATNSTLTFSGSYDGSTARTVGLNLANANTWTALQTINYASSTAHSISNELTIPHSGTVPTLYAGDVYANTNSTASSSIAVNDGTNTHNLFAVHTVSVPVASSTLSYLGSFVNATNTYVVFGTGSATTTALQCSTSGTAITYASNNTWKGRQTVYMAIGSASGTTTLALSNPLHGSILQSGYCKTDAATPNVFTVSADVEDTN